MAAQIGERAAQSDMIVDQHIGCTSLHVSSRRSRGGINQVKLQFKLYNYKQIDGKWVWSLIA